MPYIYLLVIFFMRIELSQIKVSLIPELISQNFNLVQTSNVFIRIIGFLFGLIFGKIYMVIYKNGCRCLKTPSLLINLCKKVAKNIE